jgi:hypothetical protein
VKNQIRILSVVVIAAIYCFAIGTAFNSLNNSDFSNSSSSLQEKTISDFSAKLFYPTAASESSVNNYNNLPTPSFKNPFNGLWAIHNTSEQLLETTFSQYTNASRNFLIHNRKTDLIFPFHYFW